MINKKILGLLGLSARARNVVFGADSVEMEIKKKTVSLVIIAENASDRTKGKFKKLCSEHDISLIIAGDIDELSKAIGKNNKAIIGIKDMNISSEIKKINNGGDVIG